MPDKKNKKSEKLSAEENDLIKYLNDYLESNGSTFRTKSIILFEKNIQAPSKSAGTKSTAVNLDAESFKVFPEAYLNLAHAMSVCNPLTKPHCQNGQAICVINYGSSPYWECPD